MVVLHSARLILPGSAEIGISVSFVIYRISSL